jgi:aminopeptidase N
MSTDSLKTTRAIHADVVNPSQAIEMFDGITYSKGAAVLRMLESFVGEEAFQKGITKYLKEHALANASAQDFWNAIAAQSASAPVAEIMRSYVYQPGFPQVNVKMKGADKSAELTQYRQLKLGQDKKDPSIWLVPLVVRELVGPEKTHSEVTETTESWLLKKRTQEFASKFSHPLLVNAGGRGYYRTCYEPKHLQALQGSFQKLSPEEKIVLIGDCSSLVLPGDVPIEDLYNFVYKIKDETDPLILSDLVGFVDSPFDHVRENPPVLKAYERWAGHVLVPLKNKLDGWNQKPDDSQQTKMLRMSILGTLGTFAQDKPTIKEAFALFDKYVKDRSSINADLRGSVLSIVAFNGGKKEYDQLLQLYRSAKIPADAELALGYLDSFHQPELARRTIAMAMSKEVKLQEGLGMICGVTYNHYTRDLGWSYIKQHWNEIVHHFPENHLAALCGVANAFDTPEKEKEFKEWYAHHPIPFGKSRTARSLESMHIHVIYRQRYQKRIQNWVTAQAARS